MIKEMVMEKLLMQMEQYMKVNGLMVKKRAKENIHMQMEQYMKVNG
jgi:hypothetical protein